MFLKHACLEEIQERKIIVRNQCAVFILCLLWPKKKDTR